MSMVEKTMPIVALRGMLVMPGMLMHFDVSRKATVAAVEQAMMNDQLLFVAAQKEEKIEVPKLSDLYEVGTIAIIKQMIRMPGNTIRVMVLGVDRARLLQFTQEKPYYAGQIVTIDDDTLEDVSATKKKAMISSLHELFEAYAEESHAVGEKSLKKILRIQNVGKLVDEVAKLLPLTLEGKQSVLSEFNVKRRYEMVSSLIMEDLEVIRLRNEIQTRVKSGLDKNQKEYYLREQMKVIRQELGEGDGVDEVEQFTRKLAELEASEEIKSKIKIEIDRYRNIANNSSENTVARGYIETLLAMPWDKRSEDCKDIVRTEKILEEEHYGLEKVKERILESLAVRMLNEKGDSPIICLVGPPGTGKTSIARSIARSLNKEYVRICLGGVRDEAEIRGHRKTYVGAMPGRIAMAMKNVGVKNPLMLLDEIDKVSSDHRGDTSSALLEVLDGEQNNRFVDHYVELPMDLSEVFFVATANSLQTIPKPLLDRMEIIEVSSYTENEKFHIAKKYLLKKQLEKNGLKPRQISIDKKAMEQIIHGYTREAGVRKLERTIGSICRKFAKEALEEARAEGLEGTPNELIAEKKAKISVKDLEHYLGKVKYRSDEVNRKAQVGIVRGLAWTSDGGDTLEIEVNVMPGKGNLTLTGKLGDVMKESARIALTYVRSISEEYKIPEEYFYKHDVHLHVPEGATPKDGPSAGITMATAILSAVTGKKVHADVAMTGEITLRGRVLPIGGLKEKLLAAKKAKAKIAIVPVENRKDVEELEEEITSGLEIVFAEHMKEVIDVAIIL